MAVRGENPSTPAADRIGGLRRFIPEPCTWMRRPIGFVFIGRHQPTASLPVAQLEGYVSPQTCRGLWVESIRGDAVLAAVVRRMAKLALAARIPTHSVWRTRCGD